MSTVSLLPIPQFCYTGFLLSVLLAAGCSDGSGTGSFPQNDAAGGSGAPYSSTDLNGTLTGRIYVSESEGYLDLNSGETVVVSENEVLPGWDGKEYVEIDDDYQFLPDAGCAGFSADTDRIIIRDTATGLPNASFEIMSTAYGPVKLSPDGNAVAMIWRDDSSCSSESAALTLFTRDGKQIIRAVPSVQSYDWLPDNRLVFSNDQIISVEVEPYTLRSQRIADMSNVPGTPRKFAVSPDGKTLLFEMVTDASSFLETIKSRQATLWRINIDGTGLQLLITSNAPNDPSTTFDDPQINMPAWSPDGSYFLTTDEYTSGGAILVYGFEGEEFDVITGIDVIPVNNKGITYAIPATTSPITLPPEKYDAAGIRPLFGTDEEKNINIERLNPFGSMRWIASPTESVSAAGSLPNNNSVNRGLAGKLYRNTENDNDQRYIEELDLQTGTTRTVIAFTDEDIDFSTNNIAMSEDATRIAIYVYRGVDDASIQVYSVEGEQLKNYEAVTNNYHLEAESALHFSPVNNNYLAWVYDNDKFGTGVIVLNTETDRFVENFDDRNYDELAWAPNGDLILTDSGQVYRAAASNGTFSSPVFLFDFKDHIHTPDVHPSGETLLFQAGRQIITTSLDGQVVNRITHHTEYAEFDPKWSPDGRFIVMLKKAIDSFGWPYIVAADARNVRIYESLRSPAAMRVGENTNLDWRLTRTPVLWR